MTLQHKTYVKTILTGMNGTVAPVLAETLRRAGHEIVSWDRGRVPTDDAGAMRRFLDEVEPDWVCHLSLGAEAWARFLAEECRRRGSGFLFTSTAMVFDHVPDGPHRVDDERTAKDDYGRYKIRCEDEIHAVSDRAIIARLGWQIGEGRGGNNMVEALWGMVERDGRIRASRRWTPAASRLVDTCDALRRLMEDHEPGVYHLDSNAHCALRFPEIVRRLASRLGADWPIEVTEDYVHDQRLLDDRIELPSLGERLGEP